LGFSGFGFLSKWAPCPLFFVPGPERDTAPSSKIKTLETGLQDMYHEIPRPLLDVIEPIVAGYGLELVDASLVGGGARRRLNVILDTPAGDGRVTIDECAAVSRELGNALDVAEAVDGAYVLEVSSPGVDRILSREKDFERVLGRRVAVETREPIEGRRRFRGELTEFGDGGLRVETDSGVVSIPFEGVARAQAFYPAEDVPARPGRKR
jgi:ribosome maturation factor RimP